MEKSCVSGSSSPRDFSFTEVTSDIFGGAGLTGSNITVADLDGDGYPDFAVTAGDTARGSFKIMHNEQGRSFKDITASTGLAVQAATFIVFADVDNDGDQDALLVVNKQEGDDSPDSTNLFLNDGQAHFTVINPGQFGKGVKPNISAAFTDYDHDGLVDIFIANHYAKYGYLDSAKADLLYQNNGNGEFYDVTKLTGLLLKGFTGSNMAAGLNPKPSWGASACDLNDDGYDELLVSAYGRQYNDLFLNDYVNSEKFIHTGIDNGVAADDNLDYSDNLFYLCYCAAHPDVAACEGMQKIAVENCGGMTENWYVGSDDQGYRLGGNSSNFLCGDLDGDGDVDLVSLELKHEHIGQSSDQTEILLNDGFPQKPFRRPGNEVTGLGRDHKLKNEYYNEGDLAGALADLDNDGRLDVIVASSDYPGTNMLVWQQQSDGTFKEVSSIVGLALPRAHGLGLIDYDLDGDLDIIAGTSLMRWAQTDDPPAPDAAYVHIFRNDTPANNKLILKLVGGGQNGQASRDAIGAKVTVKTASGRTLVRSRQGAYGLTGIQNDGTIIIGLGEECEPDGVISEITVRWPNSKNETVTYKNLYLNYPVELHEDGTVEYKKAN